MSAARQQSHWADITEAGTKWGVRFLFFCYAIGGKPLYKVFLAPVIAYFFIFRATNRRASLAYIRRIQQLLPAYRQKNTYLLSVQHFWHFALCIIDKVAVWMGRIPFASTTSHRGDIISDLCERRQGAVLLLSHLGNTEICRVFSSRRDNFKLTVLMHTKHAQNFNRLLESHQDGRVEIVQVTEVNPATAMMLSERIERGEFIAIAADRVAINNPESNLSLPFLGESAPFPAGPFTLAAILKAPLVSVFCLREANHHHIYFDYVSEKVECPRSQRQQTIQQLARTYVSLLERYCLQAPLQWFNFYDFWAQPHVQSQAQPQYGEKQHDQV